MTLPSDTQVMITREFDAPKHLVFRAWTTPEMIKRWWSARRGEVVTADVDLRVGGRWRWVMVTPKGFEVAFSGVYREIVPNERIVCTETYEGAPHNEAVTTLSFVEVAGRTTLTVMVQHANKADRDAHVNSGMEAGMQDAMDLLEELVGALPR